MDTADSHSRRIGDTPLYGSVPLPAPFHVRLLFILFHGEHVEPPSRLFRPDISVPARVRRHSRLQPGHFYVVGTRALPGNDSGSRGGRNICFAYLLSRIQDEGYLLCYRHTDST